MKGLFLKEFYTIKNDIPMFTLFGILLFVFYKIINVPLADLIVGFVIFILFISNYIKYEILNNKTNFNMYLRVLPINSNKVILAKYLFTILLSSVILFICLVLLLPFVNEVAQEAKNLKYYLGYLFAFNTMILYFPITYLVFIYLKETLIANIISICLSVSFSLLINGLIAYGLYVIFMKIINSNISIISESVYLIPSLINTFISSIIGYLIYKCICFKYKKIEY